MLPEAPPPPPPPPAALKYVVADVFPTIVAAEPDEPTPPAVPPAPPAGTVMFKVVSPPAITKYFSIG
jgi:hypothetical protein